MVEKWLVQVESVMIQSLKDITKKAIDNYMISERPPWILAWPGQIVQCVDCIQWTMEVTNAIFGGTLAEQEELNTEQIEQCVKMVQGTLKPNNQVTVEALIVIDVHCELFSIPKALVIIYAFFTFRQRHRKTTKRIKGDFNS